MTEEELLRKAAKGDEDAFAQLMEAHQGKVYGLILRLTGSVEDALELSQETFFNAWRGLPNFHFDSRFSTWLYRLATNVAIDFLRKEKRRRSVNVTSLSNDEDDGQRLLEIPDERFTPHQEAEKRELQTMVRQGMEQLSYEHRQVLLLREISGLSYAEIAEKLELEEGTVKSRIARARMALKGILTKEGNFSPADASKPTAKKKGGSEPCTAKKPLS